MIQTRPVLISLWVLIGSVLGGLLLLALLVFCLWKVSRAVVGRTGLVPTRGGVLDGRRENRVCAGQAVGVMPTLPR